MSYSVQKSTCEKYYIKFDKCGTWAEITIDETGMFNVNSDYGSYGYHWTSFGESFKSFLVDICRRCEEYPTSYLYTKLCDHEKCNMIDVEKTVTLYKKEIIRKRRGGRNCTFSSDYISPEDAKECWEALDELENEHNLVTADFFYMTLMHDSRVKEEVLPWEYIIYENVNSYDRECEAFCRVIAPVFAEILQKELDSQVLEPVG